MQELLKYNDLLIAISYFSIPIQIVLSLIKYPRLHAMPFKILLLGILFALFIFSCGVGHLFRFLHLHNEFIFDVINSLTMVISITTAIYLIPLVPNLMEIVDAQIQELVKQNEEREAFLAVLAHEIRTPLFAITSAATFCEDDGSNVQESVATIKQSAHLILRLVNDVLDISRLQSGRIRFEEHPFSLTDLVGQISSSTNLQLKEKPAVKFIDEITPDTPQYICGDSARLLQIFNNLVSNAVKYTESGQIELHVRTVNYQNCLRKGLVTVSHKPNNGSCKNSKKSKGTHGKDDDSVDSFRMEGHENDPSSNGEAMQMHHSLISLEEGCGVTFDGPCDVAVLKIGVVDTGTGIPEDRLESIFEPYTQAKLSDYRKHGGTGLGLSITKRLIEGMNGSLHVDSTEGQGSTFTVYLPVGVEVLKHPALVKTVASTQPLEESLLSTVSAELKRNSSNHDYLLESPSATPLCGPSLAIPGSSVAAISFPPSSGSATPTTELSSSLSASVPTPTPSVGVSKNPAPLPSAESSSPSLNSVVLVVDDNAMNCKLLGRMLKHFKLEYRTVYNGQEAIDAFLESRNVNSQKTDAPYYALVFMDWQMPIMDGRAATEKLREMKLDVPIVALTANVAQKFKDEALAAGANEFATKPILRDELFKKCQRYIPSLEN